MSFYEVFSGGFGAALSLIACLFVGRYYRSSPLLTPYLCLWFSLDALYCVLGALGEYYRSDEYKRVIWSARPIFLLAPGAIYWHCRAVLTGVSALRKSDFVWFIPTLLAIPICMAAQFLDKETFDAFHNWRTDGQGVFVLFLIIMYQILYLSFYLLYITSFFIIFKMIYKRTTSLKSIFSDTQSIELYSLRGLLLPLFLIVGMSIFFVLIYFLNYFFGLSDVLNEVTRIPSRLLFYIAAIMMTVSPIFMAMEEINRRSSRTAPLPTPEEAAGDDAAASKYERSALDDGAVERLLTKLDRIMEQERPYLSGTLTLAVLSQKTGIAAHYISQALNQRRDQSFFEYVNHWRVKEVAARLSSAEQAESTIIDIAYAAGFNSKSTFNAAFKKHLGETPSAYRKRIAAVINI